jgi:hypothetical protein
MRKTGAEKSELYDETWARRFFSLGESVYKGSKI